MKGSFYAVLILVLLSASTAFGQLTDLNETLIEFGRFEQVNFDFRGGGARAEAMGGAHIGVSDDVYGGSWNPAGTYVIEKPIFGASWASVSPVGSNTRLTPNNLLFDYEPAGSFGGVTALNFAAPLRIKGHPFVGSFNFTRNFDVYQYDAGAFDGIIPWPVADGFRDEEVEMEWTSSLEGSVNSTNFSLGTRLYEKLSFGVAANIYTGKLLRQFNRYRVFPEFDHNDGMQTFVGEEYVTVTDTNKVSGINFTTGFKYSGDMLSLGLIIRTPFSLKMANDTIATQEAYGNGVLIDDATGTRYAMDCRTEYDIPWMVGLGIGYQVNENFLWAADIELRTFKGGKVNVLDSLTINPSGENIEYFTEIDPRWLNVIALRTGAEYLLQTGLGEIPLRGGFSFTPEPSPNIGSGVDGEIVFYAARRYGWSAGTGIHWEQIRFDIAYSWSEVNRFVILSREYTERNQRINVSFTGVF